jgi:heme A synthase
LRTQPLRSRGGRLVRGMLVVAAFLALALGGLVAALEAGFADGEIRDRARAALAKAVGPENRADLGSAARAADMARAAGA